MQISMLPNPHTRLKLRRVVLYEARGQTAAYHRGCSDSLSIETLHRKHADDGSLILTEARAASRENEGRRRGCERQNFWIRDQKFR